VKDATTDEAQIRAWWAKWPDANIAVACGTESGIFVVDVDVQESGIDGWATIQKFQDIGKFLPNTVRQDTPRGGAHFFYRSDAPPANKNAFCPGIDIRSTGYYVVLAPSVHPNGGTYAWSAGKSPWETEYGEFPDFMRPMAVVPWRRQAAAQAVAVEVPAAGSPVDADLDRRIRADIATYDIATQGERGHDTCLRHAIRLVQGWDLDEETAFKYLAEEWNPRCQPPWDLGDQADYKDLRRKVSEANKQPRNERRGNLRGDDLPLMDFSGLLVNVVPPATFDASYESDPSEVEYLCRPVGLAGEVCSWINETSIKEQPWLTLGCVLAFLGALFGRKVRTQSGLRTNVYCMGVAHSSAGKAHAPNQIRRLADISGCGDLIGGDDLASDAAIEQRLERHESTLFMMDEIGFLMSSIKDGSSQHTAKIVPALMKLYSSSGNVYIGKECASRPAVRLSQPCCCIYGTSTPDRFSDGVSRSELDDGWLSRCLVFQTKSDPRKRRGIVELDVPGHIIEQVSQWFTRIPEQGADFANITGGSLHPGVTSPCPKQIVVHSGSDSELEFERLDDDAHNMGIISPQFRALWAKAEENARRIALIIASGDSFDAPEITGPIAEYACRLIRTLICDFTANIVPRIAENKVELNKQRILDVITSAGVEGCNTTALTKATKWLNASDRKPLLADLVDAGQVASKAVPNSRQVMYWSASNFAKHEGIVQ
jgi:hypothetical protein